VPLTGIVRAAAASVVATTAGPYPALRAARLAPTEALRSV
jgi:ABC-type lipoprotein release transport system permease subunit